MLTSLPVVASSIENNQTFDAMNALCKISGEYLDMATKREGENVNIQAKTIAVEALASLFSGGQKLCKFAGCKEPPSKRSCYCTEHVGTRRCQYAGCCKCAQGGTLFCIAHGGGRRCSYPGCAKAARDKQFCVGHGGGKVMTAFWIVFFFFISSYLCDLHVEMQD